MDWAHNSGTDPMIIQRLDSLEKALFQEGYQTRTQLDSWLSKGASQITTAEMVVNYKKRKLAVFDDLWKQVNWAYYIVFPNVGQMHVVEFIQRYKIVIPFLEEITLVIKTLSIKKLLVLVTWIQIAVKVMLVILKLFHLASTAACIQHSTKCIS